MAKHTKSENEVAITSEKTINKEQQEKYLLAQSIHSEFSGPLPHPDILAKYEKVYPGAASKIFQMAEDQANHRRKMESENLRLAARDSRLGIIFGFIIAIIGIIFGVLIVYLNPESAANAIGGSAVSGSSLVAIIRTFVIGSKKKSENSKNNK